VKLDSFIFVQPKPISMNSRLTSVPSGPIAIGYIVASADGAMAAVIINAARVALIFILQLYFHSSQSEVM
jgi:ribonuclease PH